MSEQIDYYLKYAKLALDSGNSDLGSKVLKNVEIELKNKNKIIKSTKLNNQLAKVEFAMYQNQFNSGLRQVSISNLEKLLADKEDLEPLLKSELYLKLGEWHFELSEI